MVAPRERARAAPPAKGGMTRVSRKVSVLGVIVVMMVTVMATVAVAFAAPGEGGTGQENGQGNGQGNGLEKVTICHNGHTITVGAPGAAAHLAHHDGDD